MAGPKRAARKAVESTIGNRIAPPRFLLFMALAPAVFFALTELHWGRDWQDQAAMAFDAAAAVFLATLLPLLKDASPADMRRHAAANDANRVLVLVITSVAMLAVMAALTGELAVAKTGDTLAKFKLIGTLALIWTFVNVIYAMHYAHLYYSSMEGTGKDMGGLDVPGTKTPGYLDFCYFAMTLGMTFQTSDVQITAPRMRRVALVHSIAAFVFNLGVIAFSINALGSTG